MFACKTLQISWNYTILRIYEEAGSQKYKPNVSLDSLVLIFVHRERLSKESALGNVALQYTQLDNLLFFTLYTTITPTVLHTTHHYVSHFILRTLHTLYCKLLHFTMHTTAFHTVHHYISHCTPLYFTLHTTTFHTAHHCISHCTVLKTKAMLHSELNSSLQHAQVQVYCCQ